MSKKSLTYEQIMARAKILKQYGFDILNDTDYELDWGFVQQQVRMTFSFMPSIPDERLPEFAIKALLAAGQHIGQCLARAEFRKALGLGTVDIFENTYNVQYYLK